MLPESLRSKQRERTRSVIPLEVCVARIAGDAVSRMCFLAAHPAFGATRFALASDCFNGRPLDFLEEMSKCECTATV